MSGDEDVVGGEIKTPLIFVVYGVSEENTSGGLGCQFVSGSGGEIRIASTIKHVQVLIGGGDSMEGEVWACCADRLDVEVFQQICGGVEPFYPVASRNRRQNAGNTAYC
jgi:transketolase N-terminal domain/subunit